MVRGETICFPILLTACGRYRTIRNRAIICSCRWIGGTRRILWIFDKGKGALQCVLQGTPIWVVVLCVGEGCWGGKRVGWIRFCFKGRVPGCKRLNFFSRQVYTFLLHAMFACIQTDASPLHPVTHDCGEVDHHWRLGESFQEAVLYEVCYQKNGEAAKMQH